MAETVKAPEPPTPAGAPIPGARPGTAPAGSGVPGGLPAPPTQPSLGGHPSGPIRPSGDGNSAGGARPAGQAGPLPAVQAPAASAGSARAPIRTTVAGRNPFGFKVGTTHDADPWMRMLVYGPYGAGKTRLIGSCTLVKEMQDFLLIDSDKGSKTLKVFPAAISIPIDNLGEINEVFRYLREHVIYRDDPQLQQKLIELNSLANIPMKSNGE